MAGYEDVNDAERLSHDPTFRLIGSETIWERGAALTSRVHSFETELLTQADAIAAANVSGKLRYLLRPHAGNSRVLDLFSGSGTARVAAIGLGMSVVSVDLSPEALCLGRRRPAQTPLLVTP